MSQTFTGSSSQIAAVYYVINEIVSGKYLGKDGKIEKLHQHFKAHLEKLAKKYPEKVTGPFGIGAMVAFTVFGGDEAKTKNFTIKLFENGVLSFMAGATPARVRFLMPVLAVEPHHIDEVCSIIEKTLVEMK
jgi:acetylornithine aminotransferase